jgi:hypothetical protein
MAGEVGLERECRHQWSKPRALTEDARLTRVEGRKVQRLQARDVTLDRAPDVLYVVVLMSDEPQLLHEHVRLERGGGVDRPPAIDAGTRGLEPVADHPGARVVLPLRGTFLPELRGRRDEPDQRWQNPNAVFIPGSSFRTLEYDEGDRESAEKTVVVASHDAATSRFPLRESMDGGSFVEHPQVTL